MLVKLFKYFGFWLTLFALCICLFNVSGLDDKNLLLYFTNPLLWFLQDFASFLKRFISEQLLMCLFYFLSLFFWCCVGMVLDTFFHRSNRSKILLYLFRIGLASCVVIILSVGFYTVQNTETKITEIIKNPDQHNEYSIRIAVVKSAKEGYGAKYIEEMTSILQSTNSREVHGSTLRALGIIGNPAAIKTMMEHYHDKEDILYALQTNENTIISMLNNDQPKQIVTAAIEATKLLEFDTFINPLNRIMNESSNEEIQQEAKEALAQISQNPKKNNPKFNMD